MLLGVDDLFSEFERIQSKNGKIQGFAIDQLSSVDVFTVFEGLGYEA